MGKKRGQIGKYSKISDQKKYQLVRSVQSNGLSLRTTSKDMEINYSTAKSILFQFRNKTIKNLTLLDNLKQKRQLMFPPGSLIAFYKPYIPSQKPNQPIKIYSTLNGQILNQQENSSHEAPKIQQLNQVSHKDPENATLYSRFKTNCMHPNINEVYQNKDFNKN